MVRDITICEHAPCRCKDAREGLDTVPSTCPFIEANIQRDIEMAQHNLQNLQARLAGPKQQEPAT